MVQDDWPLTLCLFPHNLGSPLRVLRHPQFHSLGSDLLGGGLPGFSTVQEQTPICGRSGMRWSCGDVNSCNSTVVQGDGMGRLRLICDFNQF